MAANLNNVKAIDPDDPAYQTLLAKLQGNILKGHGRDHSVNIFFSFGAGPLADVSALRHHLIGITSRYVTSAAQQLRDRDNFKNFQKPGGLFGNFFLTSQGYQKLGFTAAQLQSALPEKPNQGAGVKNASSNFFDGMAKNGADLNDPPPSAWEDIYSGVNIDAMILLADSDLTFLLAVTDALVTQINGFATVLGVEQGSALRNAAGEGIEHFGYVDGRSQPIYIDDDLTAEGTTNNWNPVEPLARVLVADGLAPGEDSFGSFFVFRKLEQNVQGFVQAEQDLASTLGLLDADTRRAGAMVVGRFRDGSPLVLSSAGGAQPPKDNDFQNSVDPSALRCPFQAHIRKTNPRGDIANKIGSTQELVERPRRITRRAIPYGDVPVPNDDIADSAIFPTSGAGLLFMCFQSDISAQFAFLQESWVNSENFVNPAVGVDPVIGQSALTAGAPAPIAQNWPLKWGHPSTGAAQFGGFVTLKGGEFFFAPSITFLLSFAPA